MRSATNILKRTRWSPYSVGALIGVLSWVTFAVMDKAIGVSTTFVRAAGVIEGTVAPEYVQANSYFAKYLVGKPAFEWQAALVVALFFGALLASKLGGQRRIEHVPSIWRETVSSSRPLRYISAFLGGALVLFGARLAGGCTSGHGISGALQLAVSGWMFLASVFAAGIATAFILYRKKI